MREMPDVDDVTQTIIPPLGECDAADIGEIPPRGWLLGNSFCRKFVSSLLADGGVGKTALRIAQLLALATGRQLTGEHVFQRCRVLIVSLEDDMDELKRRLLAAMMYYGVTADDVRGWLFFCAPGRAAGKLATIGDKGQLVTGTFGPAIERVVITRKIDIVSIDPFVKSHSVEENGNSAVDDVMQILTEMASRHDIALDTPHHTSKGAADPGNANRGRGASAMKDAARLVYTLSPMSEDEAQAMGVSDAERRRLIRMDSAKVNICPATDAKWFRLIGVKLGNGDTASPYPHGDEVQTVKVWLPPDAWQGIDAALQKLILADIEAGLPDGSHYSAAKQATDRAAWNVVLKHAPDKTEAQARIIIKAWLKNETLVEFTYQDEKARKPRKGVRVNEEWHATGA